MSLSTTPTSTTDVLIVGASLAGLVMACELLRRGIACRLIDQNATHVATSRAFGLHPRTLELLGQLRVLDEISAQGQPLYGMMAYSGGHVLTHVLLDASSQHTRHNSMFMLPLAEVEKTLRACVASLGGRVEYYDICIKNGRYASSQ